ncbi:MFS transporter [Companilactobacillus halodurans]|uniref:Multidrug efflux MFS transporter n=1 Tax=Companilactobacillus halodurans TaxID=2584183 RepID=A0A5P0ZMA7_9LACO|nr:MFS transporter [Companilactobacillus halodurans]MQS75312.1 multidrug efflux MFS transporter [Companilactobacillus halodurans]MQS98569.1 multidrug efflux MFS transporter [Companilactobacillus halodurans]
MTNQNETKLFPAIFAAGLLSFSGVIVETAMNIIFPVLMKEFHINTATVQWMTTAYILIVSIFVPISAFLKRRFKTRSLFITANLLFIIGLVIDSIAPTFSILLSGRILQGVGTGIALPLMFNIILDWAPENRKATLIGVGTLITAIAPALGPTLGGIVLNSLGWHWIFILLLPLLVISFILGFFSIGQAHDTEKKGFDFFGWVAIILTFVGLTLAFNNLSIIDSKPIQFIGWLLIGLLGLVCFVYQTSHSKRPLINLSIFKNWSFNWHILAFFLIQSIVLGLSFILPNYIQLVDGKSALLAGFFVLPGAAIGALLAPFGGRFMDIFGEARAVLSGAAIVLIAMILFSAFGLVLSGQAILLIYAFLMVGVGIVMANTMTSGLAQLSVFHQADGNAAFTTLQQFAGATGTSLVSAIITLQQDRPIGTMAVNTARGSMYAFILLLAFIVFAIIFLVAALRTRKTA